MYRTNTSNYATANTNNVNEKAINMKFGKDSEKVFLKLINKKFPSYSWYAYKNNFESVDFYGIPKQEELYGVKDNFYDIDGSKVEIVIELKTKRMLVNSKTQKLCKGGTKSTIDKEYSTLFHFVNWSKYEDIKTRFSEGTIKKAFLVWDYLREDCEHKLSEYDSKISGNYYFHEITPAKIYNDSLKEDYHDHTHGRTYIESWYQNENRDVEDKIVMVTNEQVLPFKYFKYFINEACEGGDATIAYEIFNRNSIIQEIKQKKIKKTINSVRIETKRDDERSQLLFKYKGYVWNQERLNKKEIITFNEYYNDNCEW